MFHSEALRLPLSTPLLSTTARASDRQFSLDLGKIIYHTTEIGANEDLLVSDSLFISATLSGVAGRGQQNLGDVCNSMLWGTWWTQHRSR